MLKGSKAAVAHQRARTAFPVSTQSMLPSSDLPHAPPSREQQQQHPAHAAHQIVAASSVGAHARRSVRPATNASASAPSRHAVNAHASFGVSGTRVAVSPRRHETVQFDDDDDEDESAFDEADRYYSNGNGRRIPAAANSTSAADLAAPLVITASSGASTIRALIDNFRNAPALDPEQRRELLNPNAFFWTQPSALVMLPTPSAHRADHTNHTASSASLHSADREVARSNRVLSPSSSPPPHAHAHARQSPLRASPPTSPDGGRRSSSHSQAQSSRVSTSTPSSSSSSSSYTSYDLSSASRMASPTGTRPPALKAGAAAGSRLGADSSVSTTSAHSTAAAPPSAGAVPPLKLKALDSLGAANTTLAANLVASLVSQQHARHPQSPKHQDAQRQVSSVDHSRDGANRVDGDEDANDDDDDAILAELAATREEVRAEANALRGSSQAFAASSADAASMASAMMMMRKHSGDHGAGFHDESNASTMSADSQCNFDETTTLPTWALTAATALASANASFSETMMQSALSLLQAGLSGNGHRNEDGSVSEPPLSDTFSAIGDLVSRLPAPASDTKTAKPSLFDLARQQFEANAVTSNDHSVAAAVVDGADEFPVHHSPREPILESAAALLHRGSDTSGADASAVPGGDTMSRSGSDLSTASNSSHLTGIPGSLRHLLGGHIDPLYLSARQYQPTLSPIHSTIARTSIGDQSVAHSATLSSSASRSQILGATDPLARSQSLWDASFGSGSESADFLAASVDGAAVTASFNGSLHDAVVAAAAAAAVAEGAESIEADANTSTVLGATPAFESNQNVVAHAQASDAGAAENRTAAPASSANTSEVESDQSAAAPAAAVVGSSASADDSVVAPESSAANELPALDIPAPRETANLSNDSIINENAAEAAVLPPSQAVEVTATPVGDSSMPSAPVLSSGDAARSNANRSDADTTASSGAVTSGQPKDAAAADPAASEQNEIDAPTAEIAAAAGRKAASVSDPSDGVAPSASLLEPALPVAAMPPPSSTSSTLVDTRDRLRQDIDELRARVDETSTGTAAASAPCAAVAAPVARPGAAVGGDGDVDDDLIALLSKSARAAANASSNVDAGTDTAASTAASTAAPAVLPTTAIVEPSCEPVSGTAVGVPATLPTLAADPSVSSSASAAPSGANGNAPSSTSAGPVASALPLGAESNAAPVDESACASSSSVSSLQQPPSLSFDQQGPAAAMQPPSTGSGSVPPHDPAPSLAITQPSSLTRTSEDESQSPPPMAPSAAPSAPAAASDAASASASVDASASAPAAANAPRPAHAPRTRLDLSRRRAVAATSDAGAYSSVALGVTAALPLSLRRAMWAASAPASAQSFSDAHSAAAAAGDDKAAHAPATRTSTSPAPSLPTDSPSNEIAAGSAAGNDSAAPKTGIPPHGQQVASSADHDGNATATTAALVSVMASFAQSVAALVSALQKQSEMAAPSSSPMLSFPSSTQTLPLSASPSLPSSATRGPSLVDKAHSTDVSNTEAMSGQPIFKSGRETPLRATSDFVLVSASAASSAPPSPPPASWSSSSLTTTSTSLGAASALQPFHQSERTQRSTTPAPVALDKTRALKYPAESMPTRSENAPSSVAAIAMDESFDADVAEPLESSSTLRPASEPLPTSFLSSGPTPPPVASSVSASQAQNVTAAHAGHSDAAPLSHTDGGAEPSFSAWSRSLGESLQRQMQQQIEQQVQWQWRQFQAFQAAQQQQQQTAMGTAIATDSSIGSFDAGAYRPPNAELPRHSSTVPSSAPPLDPPAYQYEALLPPAYEAAEPLAHAPPTYSFSLHERLAARSLAVDEEEHVRARAALLERLRPPMPRLASLRAGRFASANASASSEEASAGTDAGNDDSGGAPLGLEVNPSSAMAEARSTPASSAPISPASAGDSDRASRHYSESPLRVGNAFVAAAAAGALQPVVSRRNSDVSVSAPEPPPRSRELSRAASLLAITTAPSSSSSAPAVSSSALAALASLSLMDASPPPSPPPRASSSASISRESLSPLLSPPAVTSSSSASTAVESLLSPIAQKLDLTA